MTGRGHDPPAWLNATAGRGPRCGAPLGLLAGASDSACRCDAAPAGQCGAAEIAVPRDHGGGCAERECAREMNGVVAAELELLGKIAGSSCEHLVDPDRDELGVRRFEVLERPAVGAGAETAGTPRGRQCGASFGIGEDARGDLMARGPKICGKLGAVLDDDELDERRGVEVERQCRCSATRSDTEPRGLTPARRSRRGRAGGVIRPRRASSWSGSSPVMPASRAIGRPRRVTTMSAPCSTRSRCSLRRSWRSLTPTS